MKKIKNILLSTGLLASIAVPTLSVVGATTISKATELSKINNSAKASNANVGGLF